MIKAKNSDSPIKSFILVKGLDSEWALAHKAFFKGDEKPLQDFRHKYGWDIFRVARNLNQSRYERYKNCKNKIGSIIEGGQAWFGTLTFTDEVLATTSAQTRRRYVSRQLKAVSSCYVANIDFGDKLKNPDSNEREHYHFVLYSEQEPDLSNWTTNYGFIKVKKCGDAEKDIKKVCKYTAKLSHHALKASTQKILNDYGEVGIGAIPRLIYSRGSVALPPAWLFDD